MSYPFKVLGKTIDFEFGDRYTIKTQTCIHCKETGTVEIFAQELLYLHQGMHIQDAVKSLDKDYRERNDYRHTP